MLKHAIFFSLSLAFLSAGEISVDLNDPICTLHSISTEHGGVIKTDNLRIQASNLELTDKDGNKVLKASKDLLVVYKDNYLVGDFFTYDFSTNSGELTNGTTMVNRVFVGGEKILFLSDGTIHAENAHVSTSEEKEPTWKVAAEKVHVTETTEAKGENVTFNVLNTPLLWIPTFSKTINPKYAVEPTTSYNIYFESGKGPLVSLNYKTLDRENLKIYTRGDIRAPYALKEPRSLGASFEVDWKSTDSNLTLKARNYYAYDLTINEKTSERVGSRYRAQGQYKGKHDSGKVESSCQWDLASDKDMDKDFPSRHMPIKTGFRTDAALKGRYDPAFLSLYVHPRMNGFEGFKQELPTFSAALKPYLIGSTGIISENFFKTGYINYAHAPSLAATVPDKRAGRFQSKHSLYKHFTLGNIHFLPKVGVDSLLHTNSPTGDAKGLLSVRYDLDAKTTFQKTYTHFTHQVEPYALFRNRTTPTLSSDQFYFFDLQDGFHRLNQVKLGLQNNLYTTSAFLPHANVGCNLFAYSFYRHPNFSSLFPKVGADLVWNLGRGKVHSEFGWNMEQNVYDYIHVGTGWTFSDNLAFSTEVRNRGPYNWRKCNGENFLLDYARPSSALILSPLSDRRSTLHNKLQFGIAPLWTLQLQNEMGWWQTGWDLYSAYGISLSTVISNAWVLQLNYDTKPTLIKTPGTFVPGRADWNFSFNLSLL
jgi:hypothetical protein